ncbi:hypothetical protein AMTRI_Chr09g16780 [Amborella trichopoda]
MSEKRFSNGVPFTSLPENYVRPLSERPNLHEVTPCDAVPVINLNNPNKTQIVKQIQSACESYGFFQVVEHGIPEESIKAMQQIGKDFFNLPLQEKLQHYSDDPAKKFRLSTSFNVKKEKIHNWRDYLRLHCYPLEDYVHEWPSNPPSFKEVVSQYSRDVRELGVRIMELMSQSLGLEGEYIEQALGKQGQHMAINYYPPCPEPELTYGLPGHTDPNALTILLQDQVRGLQVLKDGKWVAVDPIPNAFIVNIGDQLQALSNGRYKSVMHRAVVNSEKERFSFAVFICPSTDAELGPIPLLIKDNNPAIYRRFTYGEYYEQFWSGNLDGVHCLEFFRVPSSSGD